MSPTFLLHHCPIYLGPLAESIPSWLKNQDYSQVFVLCDENTRQNCLPYFLEKTGLPYKVQWTEIKSGEGEKTLATCEKIWQSMLDAKLDRRVLVVNLGGGVIGDMGGFCAATWKRGVDFVQVPTTLLSMTDAAIGGKTGIDFHGIKNIIGVFQQPAAVFVDPVFLQTLPQRELRSGFAEVIKHALIGDPNLSDRLLSMETIRSANWTDILQKSIAVKVRVVQEDPLEKGLRMLLNFGHTIGHALESWFLETDEPLTHGVAIYIGMICEAGFLMGKRDLRAEVVALGQNVFPHLKIDPNIFPAIWERMQQDKKNSSGTVRMAVPDEMPFSLKIIEPDQLAVERSLTFYNTLS
ncbi:MAG: 3-dehydroquinate synthase [Saprospiraceae bacterium]|nr:3-dehydroquinate synthase [Saprospiraceae bacterium]